jgi:hypothetical protein
MCCNKFIGTQSGSPMHVAGVPGAFNPILACSIQSVAAAAISATNPPAASEPSGVSAGNCADHPSLTSVSAAIRDISSLSEEDS